MKSGKNMMQKKVSNEELKKYSLAANKEVASIAAELIAFRELKGEQVPVAYLIHEKAKPARLSFQNLKGFVSQSDIEEHELWQEELFTAPQKPVVLPERMTPEDVRWHLKQSDHDDGEPGRIEHAETIGAKMWNDCLAAIETATGVVKESE